jgi:hypothetical protein
LHIDCLLHIYSVLCTKKSFVWPPDSGIDREMAGEHNSH